jgi:2-methylisocitrate lyase-like PEP mutase family enzyme
MDKTRVGKILEKEGTVALPGVYDTLSARICERTGFPMTFVSGYSVAATAIGEPDLGLLTQTEITDRARRICQCIDIPVLVDADTGYGNPLNVHRTVRELIAAGAAGCFLEDQIWPKRCGHMRGKRIIDRDEYLQKIRAADDARAGRDFFIVARTDALALEGMDEAIARVSAAREAGANASFVEAPGSEQELAEVGRRSSGPNVANMLEGGKTPVLPKEQLAEMGFHLILHPLCGIASAARVMETVFEKLAQQGTLDASEEDVMPFSQLNELIGVNERMALAERFGVEP